MSFKNNPVSSDFINSNFQDLLTDYLGVDTIDFNDNLSVSQKKAFELFKQKKSLLILGPAGTGKSKLIKTMENYTNSYGTDKIYLSSTTGISAYNIGGVTVHSLFGIGTGDLEITQLVKKVVRKTAQKKRILNMDILVIDEISMLSASLFEKLNVICQTIRKNNLFFGGIQLILTGDVLQLGMICNKNTDIYKEIDKRQIVESPLFNTIFNKKENSVVTLCENFRQKDDPIFINLLLRVRNGTFTEDDINLLNTRKVLPKDPSKHVHIVTSNRKAQMINEIELNKLHTEEIKYTSLYSSFGSNKEMTSILTKELQSQLNLRGLNELVLKVNCRVMLVKNIDVSQGIVNGSIGTIVQFIEDKTTKLNLPLVKFDNNIELLISPTPWEIDIDNCKVTATQIPLMLAYSVTCHKIQGTTLDSAVLDIEDAFCDHQVYISLSRLKSLDGMYLKSFDSKKITVNKVMKNFLDNL